MNKLFGFCNGLRPWRYIGGLDVGHPWRWITGRLDLEESFKGAKGGSTGSANIVKATGWGRVFDLTDEIFDKHGDFVC